MHAAKQPPPGPSQQLDPLRFPLHGSRLIEASAGTGKTYTIAALYLRLVLQHGERDDERADNTPGNAFHRRLAPPEILVVTFTDAATKELRERVRTRLSEAAGYFAAGASETSAANATNAASGTADPLLRQLRADYPPERWAACAHQLQLAAEWMDEAAISTIHGWCNRMLREHAFDSGSLFTQSLETDLGELQAEAVRDYWRSFMYPLDASAAARVLRWWATPEALNQTLSQLLPHASQFAGPDLPPPQTAMATAAQQSARQLAELKAPWRTWVEELRALLDAVVASKAADGRKLQKRYYDAWLNTLRDWSENEAIPISDQFPDLKTGWQRLTPAGLAEVWKNGAAPRSIPITSHPALEALSTLQAALLQLPEARDDILRHASVWVAERLASEMARRAQMGFNDLLTRLDAALHGANGERLVEVIRQQFPVAMIDEFQDTDAVQYRIFSRIYPLASQSSAHALILIGDPKQAIYAFRGADIHTYLVARHATAGRHYTLANNFRSSAAMVAATNHCFLAAENRADGSGAFLFRQQAHNPLPFTPASAAAGQAQWQIQGERPAALTCWQWSPETQAPDKALSKEAYCMALAAICADELARLLQLGQQGQAGFAGKHGWQPLRPADCAVLVATGAQAAILREALAARGIRSVYLSENASVLQTAEASELQLWLRACADPDDGRAVRAALASLTLARDFGELDQLNHDELAWEQRVQQFHAYRQCWRQQGVLPMLHRLLHDFGVPARLLAGQDGAGERRLTNLLHLAELLQQASTRIEGEHSLLRHLAELCAGKLNGSQSSSEARQIRLESDADLVQVVTVHKSKGLEYPLVFLPFIAACRPTKPDDLPLRWHDAAGQPQLALTSDESIIAAVERERLGEDLRKLYVALTRAKYATWLGLAAVAGVEKSAIGHLLGLSALPAGSSASDRSLGAALQQWQQEQAEIAHCSISTSKHSTALSPLPGMSATAPTYRACRAAPRHAPPWWIASYSAIKDASAHRGQEYATPAAPPSAFAAFTSAAERFLQSAGENQTPEQAAEQTPASPASPDGPEAAQAPGLHDFPSGAAVGDFLHQLLEWVARQGFARIAAQPELLRDAIARRCQARGWQGWIAPLTDWLAAFLRQPLPLPGEPAAPLVLAELDSWTAEMEFWMASHKVNLRTLDALITRHSLAGAPRPALASGQMHGMFKGFIDLVAEHQGRYYVIDYKSNRLGATAAAYTPAAMQQAVLHARYDLQLTLYLLALHRLLQLRLPDYDYDRHVGGALCLFLRGSHSAGAGVFALCPPRELILALDQQLAGQAEETA